MDTGIAVAERELMRYLSIAVKTDFRMEMFSPFVDDCWHSLLRERPRYDGMCRDFVGRIVEHDTTSRCDVPKEIPWIQAYEAQYGAMNSVWFFDREGQLVDELADGYRATGRVVASWDCTPLKQSPAGVPPRPAPPPPDGEPKK